MSLDTSVNGGNSFQGRDGNDMIVLAHGSNYIVGGAGDDQVTGGDGDDYIEADTGNDTFQWRRRVRLGLLSLSAGEIDGGDGFDTVSFASEGQAVPVDLGNASNNTASAAAILRCRSRRS